MDASAGAGGRAVTTEAEVAASSQTSQASGAASHTSDAVAHVESTGASTRGPSFVSASAQTDRSIITAIRADIAEAEAYKQALRTGEIGLLRPQGANIRGADFITAARGEDGLMNILVTDVKMSTRGIFPAPRSSMPTSWLNEAADAVSPGRLNLGNQALEEEIRGGFEAGRVLRRQINVDYSPTGQGSMRGF